MIGGWLSRGIFSYHRTFVMRLTRGGRLHGQLCDVWSKASTHGQPSNTWSSYIPESWDRQHQQRGLFLLIYFSSQWDGVFWFLSQAGLTKGCICRERVWTSDGVEAVHRDSCGLLEKGSQTAQCPQLCFCVNSLQNNWALTTAQPKESLAVTVAPLYLLCPPHNSALHLMSFTKSFLKSTA